MCHQQRQSTPPPPSPTTVRATTFPTPILLNDVLFFSFPFRLSRPRNGDHKPDYVSLACTFLSFLHPCKCGCCTPPSFTRLFFVVLPLLPLPHIYSLLLLLSSFLPSFVPFYRFLMLTLLSFPSPPLYCTHTRTHARTRTRTHHYLPALLHRFFSPFLSSFFFLFPYMGSDQSRVSRTNAPLDQPIRLKDTNRMSQHAFKITFSRN